MRGTLARYEDAYLRIERETSHEMMTETRECDRRYDQQTVTTIPFPLTPIFVPEINHNHHLFRFVFVFVISSLTTLPLYASTNPPTDKPTLPPPPSSSLDYYTTSVPPPEKHKTNFLLKNMRIFEPEWRGWKNR